MNYYELIYLKKELKNKLSSYKIDLAITPYKNLLELFIVGEQKSFRLIFSTAPGNIALFLDSFRNPKKSNVFEFFEEVYGSEIKDILLTENDRLIAIVLENGYKLWFRLFSNKANALLAKDGVIQKTFKDQGEIGNPEPAPKEQELFRVDDESLAPLKALVTANPMLPRANLDELIKIHGLSEKSVHEVAEFAKELTRNLEEEAEFRLLQNGSISLFNEKMLPSETERRFDSVNELIAYRFKNYSHDQRLRQRKGEFTKALKRQIKRNNSALRNLEQADKGIEKAELYEKYGHLLMANAHLGTPVESPVSVSDLYEEGREIQIPVDTSKSLVENAEHYYDRSSNSLKSFEEAQTKTPIIRKEREELQTLLDTLEEMQSLREIQEWEKEHTKLLEGLGFGSKKKTQSNLPFHTLELDGYQIWIGKNAKSNDKLVQMSHKEDVWMHARGVPGSHLLIRMENSKGMPDKKIIEKAASFAAYNSKAKGSDLVPVIVTKSKYVRKPKGAAPGAVLVQKEQVELVTPQKPDL